MRFRKTWPLPARDVTQTEIFDMLAEACVTGHVSTGQAKTTNVLAACRILQEAAVAHIQLIGPEVPA